jgi:hypothetical protein
MWMKMGALLIGVTGRPPDERQLVRLRFSASFASGKLGTIIPATFEIALVTRVRVRPVRRAGDCEYGAVGAAMRF